MVRWPAPIFVASLFVVLIGIVAIPGYKPAYNDRYYLPNDAPANIGFAAADRHFTQARMNPDILMVNADHDMRNPADMLVLNAVARNVMHTEGIAMVQNITTPLGHSDSAQLDSVPDEYPGADQQHEPAVPERPVGQLAQDGRRNAVLDRHHGKAVRQLSHKQTALTHDSANKTQDLLATTEELRDHIADFDD